MRARCAYLHPTFCLRGGGCGSTAACDAMLFIGRAVLGLGDSSPDGSPARSVQNSPEALGAILARYVPLRAWEGMFSRARQSRRNREAMSAKLSPVS